MQEHDDIIDDAELRSCSHRLKSAKKYDKMIV
jgi:hypothetical protein